MNIATSASKGAIYTLRKSGVGYDHYNFIVAPILWIYNWAHVGVLTLEVCFFEGNQSIHLDRTRVKVLDSWLLNINCSRGGEV